jgi:hypothetical protein
MIKIPLITVLIFCASFYSEAQNIIPNPSFEDTIKRNFGLKYADGWNNPTRSTPDYYTIFHNQKHPDFGIPQNLIGFQQPNFGRAYIGIRIYPLDSRFMAWKREYLQSKLLNPLKKDSIYCLQLFVSLADSVTFASKNQLGIYFSGTKVNTATDSNLPYTPQIIVSPEDYIIEKKKWLK